MSLYRSTVNCIGGKRDGTHGTAHTEGKRSPDRTHKHESTHESTDTIALTPTATLRCASLPMPHTHMVTRASSNRCKRSSPAYQTCISSLIFFNSQPKTMLTCCTETPVLPRVRVATRSA